MEGSPFFICHRNSARKVVRASGYELTNLGGPSGKNTAKGDIVAAHCGFLAVRNPTNIRVAGEFRIRCICLRGLRGSVPRRLFRV